MAISPRRRLITGGYSEEHPARRSVKPWSNDQNVEPNRTPGSRIGACCRREIADG
jgi:hypothetical protein